MTYVTGDPGGTSGAIPRLFGEAFADDPRHAYDQLRAAGPVAWAELAEGVFVLVVTGHSAAGELLTDPDYTRDPRAWDALVRGVVPSNLALVCTGGVQFADGAEHERLRRALDDALAGVDLHTVRRIVQGHARALVSCFADRGHADLIAEYAEGVVLRTLGEVVGCPEETVEGLGPCLASLVAAAPDAAEAAAEVERVLCEVIADRQLNPRSDVASWLLAHPAMVDAQEAARQLTSLVVLGAPPTVAWIGATLHTLLTEPEYASELVGGAVTIRQAMNETLSRRCPVANASMHFARVPKLLCGVQVPTGVPMLVSHAATGLDPARPGRDAPRDRSHLAWSAGPHRCPAQGLAATIAETAIETVVDALWDVATPTPVIAGRPGPFQQCPVHMGVLFTPGRRGRPVGGGGRGAAGHRDSLPVRST